jgi:DNA helicase-2/ATP-dependent DNA helicase PcrA
MNEAYLNDLNQSQRDAVLYCDGPSLVIAGAGSGKTRVLTYKIAYLLDNGYAPYNILALTFTNKAAREMKERIGKLVGDRDARRLWMGTFHSIFSRILRAEAARIGFTPRFTIYDTSDSKSLLRSIMKEMGLDEKVYKPGVVQGRISNAKNNLLLPEGYAANKELCGEDESVKMPRLREVYARYMSRCKQADAMDFDDLLLHTFLLFRDNPDVLSFYSDLFRYVLVDEYQDTNYAQHKIVLQLTEKSRRVCVVGDDAQSIYSFRGADIDNILYFTKIYQEARLFKLEQNYRSTQTIVQAANSLIDKNRRQIRKRVFSENALGEAIPVAQAFSDIEEGDIVANRIVSLRRNEGYSFNDFAILYRTNAQSRVFEEALRKRSIPYRIYGGLSFYQRKEVKDVISYFRLVANPNDEEALKRIINYPARGIGDTTLGKISAAASDHGVSLWTALREPLTYGLSFNKGVTAKLQGFRELMEGFMDGRDRLDAYELGSDIVRKAGIMTDLMADDSPESVSRRENVEELMNFMKEFCASRREEGDGDSVYLTNFLSEIALLTDQDTEGDDSGETVTLMTVHSAKGLEFKNVFVVGMEEELFPSAMAGDSPRAIEEERRLFYVAITRAGEHCFLSYSKSRMRYGKMEYGSPSRFLRDIDVEYLSLPGKMSVARKVDAAARDFRNDHQQPRRQVVGTPVESRNLRRVGSLPPAASSSASANVASQLSVGVGQMISHERFGPGEVIAVEGTGDNAKATIRFKNAGEKQLLLRFARFKVL